MNPTDPTQTAVEVVSPPSPPKGPSPPGPFCPPRPPGPRPVASVEVAGQTAEEVAKVKASDSSKSPLIAHWNDPEWRRWAEVNSEVEYERAKAMVQLTTEQEMHAAWRKRAEESEVKLAEMGQRLCSQADTDDATKAYIESLREKLAEAQRQITQLQCEVSESHNDTEEAELNHAEWMEEHKQMFDRMNETIRERDELRAVVSKLQATKDGVSHEDV